MYSRASVSRGDTEGENMHFAVISRGLDRATMLVRERLLLELSTDALFANSFSIGGASFKKILWRAYNYRVVSDEMLASWFGQDDWVPGWWRGQSCTPTPSLQRCILRFIADEADIRAWELRHYLDTLDDMGL